MTDSGSSRGTRQIRKALGGIGRWLLALVIVCVIGGCARGPQTNRIQGMMLQPARDAERVGDYERALELYKDVAEDGVVAAQYRVARYYEKGQGTPQNDAEAARWYEAAANAGETRAYAPLARYYENGQGVPKDEVRAHELYVKAAATGHPYAAFKAGQFLEKGRGGMADPVGAARYYQIGAEGGDESAQLALGDLYRKGNGVAADPAAAERWYAEAAKTVKTKATERQRPRPGSPRSALSRGQGPAQGPRGRRQLAQHRRARRLCVGSVPARAAVRAGLRRCSTQPDDGGALLRDGCRTGRVQLDVCARQAVCSRQRRGAGRASGGRALAAKCRRWRGLCLCWAGRSLRQWRRPTEGRCRGDPLVHGGRAPWRCQCDAQAR